MKLLKDQITKNFKLSEFACKDKQRTMILDPDIIYHIQRLQEFRNWYNRPMIINSGYRTPEHNRAVGGATNSMHMKGIAADIALPQEYYSFSTARKNEFKKNVETKWAELCKKAGLGGGVGWYGTFFHLDSRPGSKLVVWNG